MRAVAKRFPDVSAEDITEAFQKTITQRRSAAKTRQNTMEEIISKLQSERTPESSELVALHRRFLRPILLAPDNGSLALLYRDPKVDPLKVAWLGPRRWSQTAQVGSSSLAFAKCFCRHRLHICLNSDT